MMEAAVGLGLPDFKLVFFLEDPDKDRGVLAHAFFGKQRFRFGRNGLQMRRHNLAAASK